MNETKLPYMLRINPVALIFISLFIIVIPFLVWANYAEIEQRSSAHGIVITTAKTQEIQSAIDGVIDESVRQFLIMDGGNVEVIDVKDSGEFIDIYIRYLGACNGCASSSTGTLYAIESTLKEKLSTKIRVLPI